MGKNSQHYSIWVEAEEWLPGEWTPDDANTDVVVTLENGSRWMASFFTYKNIATLTEKHRRTGEYLSGGYFWSTDMILVDEISHQRIEDVIKELISTDEFEHVFDYCPEDDGYSGSITDPG